LLPLPEKDYYWNAGVLHHFGPHLTLEENAYFRLSQNLIDLGQFGFAPIFTPFNYKNGRIWGAESTPFTTGEQQNGVCLLKTPNACDSRGLEKLEGFFQLLGRRSRRLNRHALACKPSGTC
jgi:hypothetical protein